MKIIEKSATPSGIEIQLEDWNGKLQIGAYPIAKNTNKYRWVQGGQIFRLSISANSYINYTNEDVKSDFEALKSGEKVLEDLKDRYWNGAKDQYYMGLIDKEPEY